jgi:hypothetical protein
VLCWIGLDETEKAEEWTAKLLAEDPYYTASPQDPQRFIALVENTKRGLTAKITTASSHARPTPSCETPIISVVLGSNFSPPQPTAKSAVKLNTHAIIKEIIFFIFFSY